MCPSPVEELPQTPQEVSLPSSPPGFELSRRGVGSGEFYRSTSALLQDLRSRGLSDEQNYRTWQQLRFELGEVYDSHSLRNSWAQLELLVPFVYRLPIARSLKEGIEREYHQSHLKDALMHPDDYPEGSRHRLEYSVKTSPSQTLLTAYRNRNSVANDIASVFERLPLDRFLHRNETSEPNNEPPRYDSGASRRPVIPSFRANRSGLAAELKGAEKALARLYRDDYVLHGKVNLLEREVRQGKDQLLDDAYKSVQDLGGTNPATRDSVLERFGGEFPITVVPEAFEQHGGRWVGKSNVFGFRIPYGQHTHIRDELEDKQSLIERGEIEAYSVTIHGRVNKQFLDWLSGATLDGHDPIPDIEILYSLSLPSGRTYTFVLKAARNYSLKPPNPVEEFSPGDQSVIDCLGKYFILPAHKKSPAIFSEFRRGDFSEEQQMQLDNLEEVKDVDTYRALLATWQRSVIQQLLESEKEFEAAFAHLSEDSVPADSGSFASFCEERLRCLPYEQEFHPPKFFELDEAERRQFMARYVPRAFSIIAEERERREREDPEAREGRRALGYRGPDGGYYLPLDHMLMDMIIDMKKRDRYRVAAAQEQGISPDQVEVPPGLGRPYEIDDQFFRVEDLPGILSGLETDKRFPRTIKLRVYDPMRPQRYSEHPIERARALMKEISETNRKRFDAVLSEFEKMQAERIRLGLATEIEITCSMVFRKLWRSTSRRIERGLVKLEEVEQARKAEFATLHKELQARSAPKAERDQVFQARRAHYEQKTEKIQASIDADYEKGEWLWHTFMPTSYLQSAVRGHSIVDSRVVKCIYSIGSDGQERLSLEVPMKHGDRRHTHSQQLGGGSMYGGGELYLVQHDRIFHNLSVWEAFDRWLKTPEGRQQWRAGELNNFTGHYMIFSDTLPYSAAVMLPRLDAAGISSDNCERVDRLLPGLRLRRAGMYRF